MKKKLSLVCVALAFCAAIVADAQLVQGQVPGLGDQVQEPGTFRRVASDINIGAPGRVWLETNLADAGLGYQGSYVTLGGKTRLFEDYFDGRWLGEARVHHSLEDGGGFFANIGIERVFTLESAGANIVFGGFYDFDGDEQGSFAHTFSQVGVNAAIKTKNWDLVGNGYFPVGVTDHETDCFFGNNLLTQFGIDSALQGFDVTLRLRPKQLAFANGTLDVGGYGYNSDLVRFFGGGRLALGFQTKRGIMVGGEINHDDRFGTTGVISLGYVFGAQGARGDDHSMLARDFESTLRNDHIVRFNQGVVLAIDPDTGAAYNVVHVDNTRDPADSDGSFESPFATLADAEAASGVGDIIFVAAGSGRRGLDTGIELQNDQFLLAAGAEHIIPLAGGTGLRLCNDIGGPSPVLSNPGGSAVVRLADNNVVSGVTIDATGASNGIVGNSVNTGTIENTSVSGAINNGVALTNISGDWNFTGNNFSENGINGLFVNGAIDPTSNFYLEDNIADNNGFDGIHFVNFEAESLRFLRNQTNGNGRHGLFLENYLTMFGDIDIIGHTADANGGIGIYVRNGDGDLDILNSQVTNNLQGGIRVEGWTNKDPDQDTVIGNTEGGTSNIFGNGVAGGGNLEFVLNGTGLRQDILVTGQSLDNGGRGVFVDVTGTDTVMNIDIIDNLSISNNLSDGIRMLANDGAVINTRIGNTEGTFALQMIDNVNAAGAGIFLAADGALGLDPATINATIDNVRITTPATTVNAGGIEVVSTNNALTNVVINNVDIDQPSLTGATTRNGGDGSEGIRLNYDNEGNPGVNTALVSNVDIHSDEGIEINTGTNTSSDIVIIDSEIRPSGQAADETVTMGNNGPFVDFFGDNGITVTTNGAGTAAIDSLTRLRIQNVLVRDFAFDGINVQTFGDSNLLLYLTNNRIINNGAGINNDDDNDQVYNENPLSNIEDPLNLIFHDGIDIEAFGQSFISTRIINNLFQENFERGLAINTFQQAQINVEMINNTFEGNDRGQDVDNIVPLTGQLTAVAIPLDDDGINDFEVINNDELFVRPYESPFVTDIDGALPVDANGNFILISVLQGIPNGAANICLDMSNNVFELGPDLQNFATPPADFTLGLDGATNGFIGGFGLTPQTYGICDGLISAEELFFENNGFDSADH